MHLSRIFFSSALILCLFLFQPARAFSFDLNSDGRALIQEAAQAFASDMQDRPIIEDAETRKYVQKIVNNLVPAGKNPPQGVVPRAVILDSPHPDLFAYVDGHIILTTSLLYAMGNEAQLAGVLSHEVAHIVEGYYINMYQEIKAAERRERTKAIAGALFGAMLDVAVDYSLDMREIEVTDEMFNGEATYKEAMQELAALDAARQGYYSLKDVISSIPVKDASGRVIDPRLRFEPVADAQGMQYMTRAGYDPAETAAGWENVQRLNRRIAREEEKMLGAWSSQLRAMQRLNELQMQRMYQYIGAGTGLVQTLSDVPASRAGFVSSLTGMQEVKQAQENSPNKTGREAYRLFLKKTLYSKAEEALQQENFSQAHSLYRILYDKGNISAPVVYGLARSQMGDFAFAASLAEKKEAEKLYKKAVALDSNYAPAYKGLGQLYEDWERYADAASAYSSYLKNSNDPSEKKRIQRRISILKRKAKR